MKRRILDRRRFIQAAGGMTLALPLLSSLRARGTPAPFPKRLVTMYTPNGQITSAWHPQTVTSETDFVLNEIHEPLAAHKDRMVLFKGIDLAIADQPASEGGGPGGPHQRGIGALYTGQHLQTGQFTDGCGSQAGWANGISIDQAVANQIGTESLFKSLELGIRATENDVQGRIAYSAAGAPLPPMLTPLDMYDRLFKDLPDAPGDGGTAPEDPQIAQTAERAPGGQWPTRLAPGQGLVGRSAKARRAPRARARPRAAPEPHDDPLRKARDAPGARSGERGRHAGNRRRRDRPPGARFRLRSLARREHHGFHREKPGALSLDPVPKCRGHDGVRASARVTPSPTCCRTIRTPADSSWRARAGTPASSPGFSTDSHRSPKATARPRTTRLLVWCSEVSEGNTHSHVNMPFLVVGGGWHFPTGRYVQCPAGTSHGNLLVSILNAMGVEATTFGVPQFATGPLAQLGLTLRQSGRLSAVRRLKSLRRGRGHVAVRIDFDARVRRQRSPTRRSLVSDSTTRQSCFEATLARRSTTTRSTLDSSQRSPAQT